MSSIEVIQETNHIVDKKVIAVCILGKTFSDAFLRCWTEFLGYCLTHNIRPLLANICESSLFIHKNQCLMCDVTKGAEQVPLNGEMDYDYILWLSGSCSFDSSKLIPRFFEMDHDIVSASSISSVNMKTMNFIKDIDFSENKAYSYVTVEEAKEMIHNEQIEVKVDFVDVKCMLLKKGVLEKIQYPWFTGDPTNLSGDVVFCQKCKTNGLDIYVDLKLPIRNETKLLI